MARGDESFKLKGNLVFHHGLLYVPSSLRTDILRLRHDSVLAGHPGRKRTLQLVSRDYSWPGMKTFIRRYVQACDVCARIKTPRHKPYGLLRPLDIPDRPWKSISMDFIVKLPPSHGYDSIWVVCDRLTRAAHFIPCNETIDAPQLAWLFIDRIFRLHGLPESIVSDRGSVFVSNFWKELTTRLGTELKMSTAYHPQTDGLTERTNQSLETYLRAYASYQQDDWVDYLPLAEFAFNNHTNSSTNQSPFFANYGFHPTFEPQITDRSTVPAAADLASRLERLHDELRAELKAAQDRQAIYYNQRAAESPKYQPGQLVWLLRRHIKSSRPSDKLDHRRLGPFPIERAISDSAYQLRLPSYLSRLHPVFNVSLLEPYSDPSDFHTHATPDPFPLADDPSSPSISQFLDCRKLGQRYEYLVRWTGLSPEEDSWIPLYDIPTTPYTNELLERFHRRHPRAIRPHQLILERTALLPTNHSSTSTLQVPSSPEPSASSSEPSAPSSEPSAPSAALPASMPMPMPVPACARSAIPRAAPRSPSPPPAPRQNLREEYVPPRRTTTRSGRVSRPPPRPDE